MQDRNRQTMEESLFSAYGNDSRFWEGIEALNENNVNNDSANKSLNDSHKEYDRVNSPNSTLDNENKIKIQPEETVENFERRDAVDQPSNYASSTHSQQGLSANPTSDPNVQMQQMNSQIYTHLYPSSHLSTIPQMHPYMSPPISPQISPYISPSITPHLSPSINPGLSSQTTSEMPQSTFPRINPQTDSTNPRVSHSTIDSAKMSPHTLRTQYQQTIPEAHSASAERSHSESTENRQSVFGNSKTMNWPNLPELQQRVKKEEETKESYPTYPKDYSKQASKKESKKRGLSASNGSTRERTKPAKKSKSQSSTKEQMAYQQLVQRYLYSQPLQYDHLIQHKYLAICQQMGPRLMYSLHEKLAEKYYAQYLRDCEISMYNSKPDPVCPNPLASPDVAQQWYQTLAVLYAQLMKWRQNRVRMSPQRTDYGESSETITVTPDLNENSVIGNSQWNVEMPDLAEVAYWNDLVIRQCMSGFAYEDPDRFERYVNAKRRELGEIMLTGTSSERSDGSS